MARFREQISGERKLIETIASACPICKSDVKGDDVYLYFCQNCNILFKKNELNLVNPDHIEHEIKKTGAEKYDQEKDKLRIEEPLIKLKPVSKKYRKKKTDKKSKIIYITSKNSNVLHVSNCPFAKNIKKSNRRMFKDLSEARGYKRCECI